MINLGDLFQRWSGDYFRSTTHRVHSPSGDRPRYSVAFFLNPNFDAEVTCISQEGMGSDGGAKYVPIKAGHYMMQRLGLMWANDDQPPEKSG